VYHVLSLDDCFGQYRSLSRLGTILIHMPHLTTSRLLTATDWRRMQTASLLNLRTTTKQMRQNACDLLINAYRSTLKKNRNRLQSKPRSLRQTSYDRAPAPCWDPLDKHRLKGSPVYSVIVQSDDRTAEVPFVLSQNSVWKNNWLGA